jgi:hypothetical protein
MDTIARSNIVKACNLLGFEPRDVMRLEIEPHEVRATIVERNEHGTKILRRENGEIVGYQTRVEVCNVRND